MAGKPDAISVDIEKAISGAVNWVLGLGPWARLWAPELAAAFPAGLLAFKFLHPHSTARWPGLFAYYTHPEAFTAWRQGLRLPNPIVAVVVATVCVGLVAVAARLDFGRGRTRRMARMLRWRWERSDLGRGSKLKDIRILSGAATATVVLRDGNWDALKDRLDLEKGKHLRDLRLKGWGTPNLATFTSAGISDRAVLSTIRLNYVPLPSAWDLEPWEEPMRGLEAMMGETVDGPLYIDLGNGPHTEVIGGTGSGKGIFEKMLECQCIYGRWLGITVDGGRSPEHGPLRGCPTWLVPMGDLALSLEQRLRATIDTFEIVDLIVTRRSRIIDALDLDRYEDLPDDVKAWQPPIGLVIDETTILLDKGKDGLDDLRARIASHITEYLRGGRKFGVYIVPMSDQILYSGVFSKGSAAQAENRIVLGNLDKRHVDMAAGVSSLPLITDPNLAGHYVKFGQSDSIREIRLRPNTRDSLKRAVAWSRGEEAA